MLTFILIGLAGGLIACSWQGFKDPPWEGFSLAKFLRSPIVGAAAGAAAFWLDRNTEVIRIDNHGLLMAAALATERLVSETYKGFLRREFHPEYLKLFLRAGFPVHRYTLRAMLGMLFLALGLLLYWSLGKLAGTILDAFGASIPGALVLGLLTGVVVATGGALKDSQFEGFKPLKFIRSPIVTALGALAIVRLSADPLLVVLAAIGFERIGVEFYKTFLTRQIRGIHATRTPPYPHWFGVRWIFFLPYAACVTWGAWLAR
jgi:hypothetical protein